MATNNNYNKSNAPETALQRYYRLKNERQYKTDTAQQQTVQPVRETPAEEQNKGGFLGGIGYGLEKLGLGIVRGLEGVADYIVAGGADLFGQDEYAEKVMTDDWMNYNHADEWYNPSEGWQTVGDITGSIGQMLPSVAAAAIPYVGPALSTGMFMTSAAGNAVSEAAKESGELGGKEWLYGSLSGAAEGAVEKVSGGIGGSKLGQVLGKQLGKTTLGKLGVTFAGEGLEEVASDLIDPALRRVTGVDKDATVDWEQLPKTFLVGGAAGSVMGAGTRAVNAARVGGFNNLNALERTAAVNEGNAELNRRAAQGRNTERSEAYVTDMRKRLERSLKKMDADTRARFFAEHPTINNTFNADGSMKAAAEVSNPAAMSAAYRNAAPSYYQRTQTLKNGNTRTLTLTPTKKTIRPEVQTALNDAVRLTDGRINYVVTDNIGKDVNGFYDRDSGTIYISSAAGAQEAARAIVSHEITHSLEGTKEYAALAEYALKSMAGREEYSPGQYMLAYAEAHPNVNADTLKYIVDTERVADYIGKELLSDEQTVRRLVESHESIARRIYNWIKDKLAILTKRGGDRETARELSRALKLYENALRHSVGGVSLDAVQAATEARNARAERTAERERNAKRTLTPAAQGGRYDLRESWQKLGSYSEEDIASIEARAIQKVAHSYEDIKDFIDKAKPGIANRYLYIGRIPDNVAEMVKTAVDVDIYGKSVVLGANEISHIFKNHGESSTETPRGQIAVTRGNIENIIDTIISPDKVRKEVDKSNTISIIFTREHNGRNFAITILSNKKKALTLKSARIIKERHISPSSDAKAPHSTSETLGSMDTAPNPIIAQKEEKSTPGAKKDEKISEKKAQTVENARKSVRLPEAGDLELLFDEDFYKQFENEDRTPIRETLEELKRQKAAPDYDALPFEEARDINMKIRALEAGYTNLYDYYVGREKARLTKDYEFSVSSGRETSAMQRVREKRKQRERQAQIEADIEESSPHKNAQFQIIQATNPMFNDTSVGIRSPKDIKTFEEAMSDEESFHWGDFTRADAEKALRRGTVRVYSSYPIKNGVFVSTSREQALQYAGGDPAGVHTRIVALDSVAWINGDEGQYAKVYGTADNVRFSLATDSAGQRLTEEQAEYFKDSKVRDKDGNLLVVYHGTAFAGVIGEMTKGNLSNGFLWATSFLPEAENYSRTPRSGFQAGDGQVISLYADIKNPKYVHAGRKFPNDPESFIDRLTDGENDGYIITYDLPHYWSYFDKPTTVESPDYYGLPIGTKLKNVYEKNDGKMTIVAVRKSSQFKRTDNKTPTANSDIRYSLDKDGKREYNTDKTEVAADGRERTPGLSWNQYRRRFNAANDSERISIIREIRGGKESKGENAEAVVAFVERIVEKSSLKSWDEQSIRETARTAGYDIVFCTTKEAQRDYITYGDILFLPDTVTTDRAGEILDELKPYRMENRERKTAHISDARWAAVREKHPDAYVTTVRIQDFLDLTADRLAQRDIHNETAALDERRLANTDDELYLKIDFTQKQVTDHEGRHRMTALRNAGYTHADVFIYPAGQNRSEVIGRIDITSQEGGRTVPLSGLIRAFSGEYSSYIHSKYRSDTDGNIRYSLKKPMSQSATEAERITAELTDRLRNEYHLNAAEVTSISAVVRKDVQAALAKKNMQKGLYTHLYKKFREKYWTEIRTRRYRNSILNTEKAFLRMTLRPFQQNGEGVAVGRTGRAGDVAIHRHGDEAGRGGFGQQTLPGKVRRPDIVFGRFGVGEHDGRFQRDVGRILAAGRQNDMRAAAPESAALLRRPRPSRPESVVPAAGKHVQQQAAAWAQTPVQSA